MPVASGFPPVSAEWTFLVVVLVILVGPLVAVRLRVPGMIGLLIGGTIVGPTVLGWVEREGAVEGIGQIGLLLLMFMAGLELDLDDFRRNRTNAVRFGGLTFGIPIVLGAVVAAAVFDYGAGAAILFGSLWASHTLVAYPIARERGLASDRGVSMAVGGTVITDTLALFVLAVVVGAHEGGSGIALIGSLVGGLALLLAVSLVVLPRAMRWFFRGPGHERNVRFAAILCAFAACAVLAHVVGLEGIVGAFFAGLALNRLVPNRGGLMDRLAFFGSSLLIPFFLVSTGMLIDPKAFGDAHTLALAGASIAILVVGKFAAASIAGRAAGLSRPQVDLVFSLSIAQAAATLAGVIIGYQAGVFEEALVNAALIVVLVSLVIASLGATRAAGRVPAERVGAPRLGGAVLVPVTDASAGDRLALAARLASAEGGIVLPLAVVSDGDDLAAIDETRRALREATASVEALAAEVEPVFRVDDAVPSAVMRAASEHDASLIVAGFDGVERATRATSSTRRENLLRNAQAPILVVRPGAGPPARVVLAVGPDDLGEGRANELELAVGIAERLAHALPGDLVVLAPAAGASRPVVLELERAPVHEYEGGLVEALEQHAQPTDVVVVPARIAHGALAVEARRLAALHAQPTLAITIAAAGRDARRMSALSGTISG